MNNQRGPLRWPRCVSNLPSAEQGDDSDLEYKQGDDRKAEHERPRPSRAPWVTATHPMVTVFAHSITSRCCTDVSIVCECRVRALSAGCLHCASGGVLRQYEATGR